MTGEGDGAGIGERGPHGLEQVRTYRCLRCGRWHVTSKRPGEYEARRAEMIAANKHYVFAPDGSLRPEFREVAR